MVHGQGENMFYLIFLNDGFAEVYAWGIREINDDDFLRLCDEAKKWTNYLERKGFKF